MSFNPSKLDQQSKLKILRAIVALRKFTAGEIISWTGLKRSQVDPQIWRFRKEGIVEFDEDPPRPEGQRPAHRPIRQYRLVFDPEKRAKAFSGIREVRLALGEDASSQQLALIDGQLQTLTALLPGSSDGNERLTWGERLKYQTALEKIGNALDEAMLELDVDDSRKSLGVRVHTLRKRHRDLIAALSRHSSGMPSKSVHSSAWSIGDFTNVDRTYGPEEMQGFANSMRIN